jgi:putative peptide maturation dehydrogenase
MILRRCVQLFVEVDQEPRFALASLLEGGDGIDRSTRWLAFSPHLREPVEVTLPQLAVLGESRSDQGITVAELATTHAEADISALIDAGLLLREADESGDGRASVDHTLRQVAWWPPAALAQAHGGWDEVDVQARNEAGLMLTSEQMVDAFGNAPSHAYRRTQSPALPLATPGWTDFDRLLSRRRTCRNFDGEAMVGAGDFATMLHRVWGAIGTQELAPGAVAVKKSSPAGGGLHAVEAYVLVQRVEGVAPGFYHYLSLEHALEPLRTLSAQEAADYAHRFVAGQNWFANVPAMVIMTARFDRLFWKYRRHAKAWRVVHLDVGHLSQTMYLSAADLDLGAFVTAAINDRLVEQALDLVPMQEGAIGIVGFGPRSNTPTRTLELDNLTPTPASLAAAAGRPPAD